MTPSSSSRSSSSSSSSFPERHPLLFLGAGFTLLAGGTFTLLYLLHQHAEASAAAAAAALSDDEDEKEANDLKTYDNEEEHVNVRKKSHTQTHSIRIKGTPRASNSLSSPVQHHNIDDAIYEELDSLEPETELERRSWRLQRRKNMKGKRLFGPHIRTFAEEERVQMMTKIGLLAKEEGWKALSNKCDDCWLLKKDCICLHLTPVTLPVDFVVFMHYKEYLRISNTGHLLTLTHKGSELLIAGRKEDDKRLTELSKLAVEEPYSVVVLMPNQQALSVAELQKGRAEQNSSSSSSDTDTHTQTQPKRLKVILIDGTWRQARSLNRRVPAEIPRVKVDVSEQQSHFQLRTRTRADGISTLEAALRFVEEMHVCEKTEKKGVEGIERLLLHWQQVQRQVLVASGKEGKIDKMKMEGKKSGEEQEEEEEEEEEEKGGERKKEEEEVEESDEKNSGSGDESGGSSTVYLDAQSSLGEEEEEEREVEEDEDEEEIVYKGGGRE